MAKKHFMAEERFVCHFFMATQRDCL